jgi:anti-sigma regulatory factor (Ser/Thr protein kinase)
VGEAVAVLVLRRRVPADGAGRASPEVDARWVYPMAPTAAGRMRRDVRAALGAGTDPDLLDDLLLAASEAVNNAVEHAGRPSRPEVEVRLRVADGGIRIAVQDFGSWRARPPAMDRGRGAMLMNAYGAVHVAATPDGTLVTIERQLR